MTEVNIESAIDPNERQRFIALWDTGASNSLIRPEVAQKLHLLPVSMTTINTPTSKNEISPVYSVNLYLPNMVRVQNVQVLEGIPSGCDMLIGMDIIGLGDFAVTNFNGKTVFSFRMPSMTTIDFVNHSYLTPIRSENKVGRNDPCPCGSGKKYKHCHGK
jgi:predicted aspartyl protease